MKADELFYSALREQVLITCGIKTICVKDCGEISIKIFEKDKNYLSGTSIKSFFGLSSNITPLSPFVLNSLARFTGYASWDNFKQKSINTNIQNAAIKPALLDIIIQFAPLESTNKRFNKVNLDF